MLFTVVGDFNAFGISKGRCDYRRECDGAFGFFFAAKFVGGDAFDAVAAQDHNFFTTELEVFKEAFVERSVPNVQVEFTFINSHRDGDIIAADLMSDLDDHFRHGWVDFSRHDGAARSTSGKVDFHPACPRTGAHKPQILADLRQCGGNGFHGAGNGENKV